MLPLPYPISTIVPKAISKIKKTFQFFKTVSFKTLAVLVARIKANLNIYKQYNNHNITIMHYLKTSQTHHLKIGREVVEANRKLQQKLLS